MAWLQYGINGHGELVSIRDVARGRTDLVCPYCGRGLTAKRGETVTDHFAHSDETCRAADRRDDLPTLPCYDNFNLHLSARDLAAVRRLHAEGAAALGEAVLDHLMGLGVVRLDTRRWPHQYELTPLGQIPVGALPLKHFEREQQRMIRQRHGELEKQAKAIKEAGLREVALTDLRLYRAQWRRILLSTLYCLEIQTPDSVLYKIGVTTRSIEERVAEILRDLRQHFAAAHVTVIGTWAHRGNVELYFKHRYARFRHPLGRLTEYFLFTHPKLVIADLRGLRAASLGRVEMGIIAGV